VGGISDFSQWGLGLELLLSCAPSAVCDTI
jgi:hypothetical protein